MGAKPDYAKHAAAHLAPEPPPLMDSEFRWTCRWCGEKVPRGEARLRLTLDGKVQQFHPICFERVR